MVELQDFTELSKEIGIDESKLLAMYSLEDKSEAAQMIRDRIDEMLIDFKLGEDEVNAEAIDEIVKSAESQFEKSFNSHGEVSLKYSNARSAKKDVVITSKPHEDTEEGDIKEFECVHQRRRVLLDLLAEVVEVHDSDTMSLRIRLRAMHPKAALASEAATTARNTTELTRIISLRALNISMNKAKVDMMNPINVIGHEVYSATGRVYCLSSAELELAKANAELVKSNCFGQSEDIAEAALRATISSAASTLALHEIAEKYYEVADTVTEEPARSALLSISDEDMMETCTNTPEDLHAILAAMDKPELESAKELLLEIDELEKQRIDKFNSTSKDEGVLAVLRGTSVKAGGKEKIGGRGRRIAANRKRRLC